MLGKNDGQIDIFNQMIFERLIPKNHLLLKIDALIDFSFIYDIVKEYYSEIGRESYDPVILFKLCLLEYLYVLSDRQVVERATTDISFRWFLKLTIEDKVPDDTTISHFRSKRLGNKPFEEFFNAIVQKCIDNDIVKTHRYIVDSTDVQANVNYPSEKKLLCNAYRRLIREIERYNNNFALKKLNEFENEIALEYEKADKVSIKTYCQIAKKHAEEIYLQCYNEFSKKEKMYDMFVTLWCIIEKYGGSKNSKDKIISCIDPDSRVAHKTKGKLKTGYKNHIIIDEESEIILASEQTPFNINDEKKLVDLVEKVEKSYNIKPEELSADKAYGTIDNRAYLKDNNIISNINFYDNSDKEYKKFDISKFTVAEDLKSATCPNNCYTEDVKLNRNKKELIIKFSQIDCFNCELRSQCFSESDLKKGIKRRRISLNVRYDAVVRDLKRLEDDAAKIALNKRCIVERRFATMVRNHGLRRCRYLRLKGAAIHITLSNMASNIIRMVKLLTDKHHSSFAIPKI